MFSPYSCGLSSPFLPLLESFFRFALGVKFATKIASLTLDLAGQFFAATSAEFIGSAMIPATEDSCAPVVADCAIWMRFVSHLLVPAEEPKEDGTTSTNASTFRMCGIARSMLGIRVS